MGEMWGSEERCREVWGEVREVWKSIGGSKVWVVGCGLDATPSFEFFSSYLVYFL